MKIQPIFGGGVGGLCLALSSCGSSKPTGSLLSQIARLGITAALATEIAQAWQMMFGLVCLLSLLPVSLPVSAISGQSAAIVFAGEAEAGVHKGTDPEISKKPRKKRRSIIIASLANTIFCDL